MSCLIPDKIKAMLFTGNAAFRTFVVAGTGSALIPTNKDSVTIVTSIKYFHCLDITEAEFQDNNPNFDAIYERSVTQIELKSPKSQNSYLIRDNVTCNRINSNDASTLNQWNVNGESTFDCFLVHEDNIQVEIVKLGAPANQGILFTDFAPANVQKSPPPEGYGNASQPGAIVQPLQIATSIADSYSVVALSKQKAGNPSGTNNVTNQFKIPVSANTAINSMDLASAYKSRAFPIVNVSLIEIRKGLYQQLQGSF